ncbi:MAG TPA: cell division protein FtsZ [Flavisolibacter sp.]|jgi:cell division protein FtsZ|nr:cell division protein FtsZ [Flavisolibacter sp.]
MIHFDLPKEKSSIIKVIGIGGGGSNAVNHMYSQNIEGVNFIICNTDAQSIAQSTVPNKVQLGPHLTQGLGAGANPDIGRQATEESLEELKAILEVNTKMAFVTAGMGGGTGTGGAPIISKICKDLGILTVGIVTTPFAYEGRKRQMQAEEGIKILKQYVDTLLVISNDKLRHQFGNLKMREAFAKADNVLATAAKCITDVINSTGQINVDFADVCTVMKNGGVAILGSAACEGEDRAQKAIEEALSSPLLNDNDIRGAKWILININSSEGEHEFTMDEVEIIQTHLLSQAGEHTDVILGLGYDNSLGNKVGITLIATGFEHKDPFVKKVAVKQEPKEERIIMTLGSEPSSTKRQPVVEELQPDLLAPSLVDEETMLENPALQLMEEEEEVAGPLQYFELGAKEPKKEEKEEEQSLSLQMKFKEELKADHSEIDAEKLEWEKKKQALEDKAEALRKNILGGQTSRSNTSQNAPSPSAGGYLARPSSIYSESKTEGPVSQPAESLRTPASKVEQPEELDMQLVIRNEKSGEDRPAATHQPEALKDGSDQTPVQDEAGEQKQRASERLQKLRNLSFNLNAADPNNEFEAVPAYIRRNMELQNSSSTVENFYSNYSVKSDGKNNATISTINTFLDGKKPD